MTFITQPGGVWILLSMIIALILDSIDLPSWLERGWPSWLALCVIYWCVQRPQHFGIGSAWVFGLMLDAAQGTLLGQHALALSIVAYLSVRSHRRLRLFPLWQQTISVLFFVAIQMLILLWINGMLGYPPRDVWFILPVLTTLLAWPLVAIVLRELSQPSYRHG